MEKTVSFGVKDGRKFEVDCDAGEAGGLCVGSESVWVKVGQRIVNEGADEIWHSVMIHGEEAEDGSYEVRVMVFHPDWDDGRQIACIRSYPAKKRNRGDMLQFDFVHGEPYFSALQSTQTNTKSVR